MELDSMDRQFPMAHRHDLAVRSRRGHLELVRDAGRRQRVVAPRLELLRQTLEETASVGAHRRRLPVDEEARRPDLAAERLDDRLMPETDPERRPPREPLDDRERVPRPARASWPGRDDEV